MTRGMRVRRRRDAAGVTRARAEWDAAGDAGAAMLRPPASAAGGRAPLLHGRGGRSVTRGT